MSDTNDIRLPRTVRPKHYFIHLKPDFNEYIFQGSVFVVVTVLEEINSIVLHAKDLAIRDAVFIQGGDIIPAISIDLDSKTERLTLMFSRSLSVGGGLLAIDFNGVLNNLMCGFYQSVYTVNGADRVMAVTQFEDTDARRAFPCWDEPAIKAKFTLTLEIPSHLQALSNMQILRELEADDKASKIVIFGPTPIMSTYLLAFVVGELECLEAVTKRGTLVRVFATPGKKEQLHFALDIGVRCLEFYEDYFEIPYPLPKLDMIAIPDFAAGAMENWGLITYRETTLLVDPVKPTELRKQGVAIVVAHEIAHQWFGDLVTMEWWTQLWLNEGFATWMEYFAVDYIFPEWHIWEQFVSDDFCAALADDSLHHTHAVEVTINHPSEIKQNFDTISYQKGAAVIRMLHDYLGAEVFRDGLRLYLRKHAYGNTTTRDLWLAFEEVSGQPVSSLMDSWTKQAGYPVITMSQDQGSGYSLTQSRFISSGAVLLPREQQQCWTVTVPYEVNNGANKQVGRCVLTELVSPPCVPVSENGWLKLNRGQTAFIRVNYTPELWLRLKGALEQGQLSTIDRVGIANDLYALVKAGHVPATQLLFLLESYRDEDSYVVWSELIASLGGLSSLFSDTGEDRELFNSFARSILTTIVQKVGWSGSPEESHGTKLLRPRVLSAYGKYGHTGILQEARDRFDDFVSHGIVLDPEMRSAIYSLVAVDGDRALYETLLKCYLATDSSEERAYYLGALGKFRDEEILRDAFVFSLSKHVRSQDVIYLAYGVNSRVAHELLWKFIQDNWDEFRGRFSAAVTMFSHLLEEVLSSFHSEEHARAIEQFFVDNPLPEVSRTINQSLERIRSRAQWLERDYASIVDWLI